MTPILDRDAVRSAFQTPGGDWPNQWGRAVTARRKAMGMTRADLADLSDTTEATITRIELGQQHPRNDMKIMIAVALGCSAVDLWPMPDFSESLRSYRDLAS